MRENKNFHAVPRDETEPLSSQGRYDHFDTLPYKRRAATLRIGNIIPSLIGTVKLKLALAPPGTLRFGSRVYAAPPVLLRLALPVILPPPSTAAPVAALISAKARSPAHLLVLKHSGLGSVDYESAACVFAGAVIIKR